MRREAEEEMRRQLEEKERAVQEEMERYSTHYPSLEGLCGNDGVNLPRG